MTTARKLLVGLAAALVLAAHAWAQPTASEDDVLQRYALATESLAEANAVLPDDAVSARSALDRAFSALLTLSRGGGASLGESLDRVFERARTAIDNESATDLAVQTTVLRGGFQRLLYESALTAAVEGRPELARTRLLGLAQDVELAPERVQSLGAVEDAGAMRQVFEAGVAETVAGRLDALADAGLPASADAAYRTLASAYADYLLVQDSGRVDPTSNRRFVEAAQALVDGDSEAYLAALTALSADMTDLRQAADAGEPGREPVPGDAAGGVVDLPTGDAGATAAPTTSDATSDATDGATDVGATDAATTPAADDGEPADEADGAADATPAGAADGDAASEPGTEDEVAGEIDLEALRAEIAAELEAAREAEAIAALRGEVVARGVPAARADALAAQLHEDGVTRVAALEDELGALAAAMGAAVLRGDADGARAALATLRDRYGAGLQPLAAASAPAAADALTGLLDRLDAAPALRETDAALLASELRALDDALRGTPVGAAHAVTAGAAAAWSGWIRSAAMVVLALLALVPLRLLGMAFGGGNRNWRLIGIALFLAFAPVFVEGVIGLAALAAGPTGLASLAGWTAASVFASDLTQFVWAAAMLLAILLAAIGFYGICVQFGVLGRRRGAAAAAPAAAGKRDDTLVDWDDDF